ncbi:hypothetical protein AKJ09_09052 [Labilithrix luteola]|uniref:Uncharacterized protein n=1 Tax=Labilithrix luteola TaxID=1391654 RepID=A0A0K1Q9H8_9BACT|nr:hypothetical protein AKJ09_09052 [Labilithrix luteola]
MTELAVEAFCPREAQPHGKREWDGRGVRQRGDSERSKSAERRLLLASVEDARHANSPSTS